MTSLEYQLIKALESAEIHKIRETTNRLNQHWAY